MEAMASSLPCLCGKIRGNTDLIQKSQRTLFCFYFALPSQTGNPLMYPTVSVSLYGGQRYDDSPRFVYEYMSNVEKTEKKYTNYKHVWAFINPDEIAAPRVSVPCIIM